MNFFEKYKWLIPMQLFIGFLIISRVFYTHTIALVFIPWNLFLAVIPLYLSFRLNKTNEHYAWLLVGAWLLFFPNAMYIITDIFHLKDDHGVPPWYDLLILFSSAISGVMVGFLSLQNVEKYLQRRIHSRYIPWVILFFFILCGYGIYLGRYLRWNSWDLFTQPFSLLTDIRQDVLHPVRNNQSWMLSILFGVWLYILYKYFKKLKYDGSVLSGK